MTAKQLFCDFTKTDFTPTNLEMLKYRNLCLAHLIKHQFYSEDENYSLTHSLKSNLRKCGKKASLMPYFTQ